MPSPLDEELRNRATAKTGLWVCAAAVVLGLFVVPGWFGETLYLAGGTLGFMTVLWLCDSPGRERRARNPLE